MEDWRFDRDANLEPSDLGFDPEDLEPGESFVVPGGQTTKASIFEDDERKMSWGSRRRTSVGWTLPPREHSKVFLQRNTITLGIEDFEEQGLLKEISERDRVLLDKTCCSEDVIRVWSHISVFILHKLREGKGVQIPGLFTITFQTEKTIMPNDSQYYVLKKIPVMIMSRFLIETYCLENKTEDEFVFRAPSVPLNLTEIATKSKISRMVVDGSVTEVLHVFARALACNKKLEFPVANIGKLHVENRRAVMKFYQEFYKNMGFHMEATIADVPLRQRRRSSSFSRETEIPPLEPQLPDTDFDILPGQMTPLRRHIPTDDYRSVFHLSEVRSVHEDELLAPVKVKHRAKVYGKFKKSVLPKSFPVDLYERMLYITQEKNTRIHDPVVHKHRFDPTPTPSLTKLKCVKVNDERRYFGFLNPDGTKLEPAVDKALRAALGKSYMMEQCDLPDRPCGTRKVTFECQFKPPRFVRSRGPPKPILEIDKVCAGIKIKKKVPSLDIMPDEEEIAEEEIEEIPGTVTEPENVVLEPQNLSLDPVPVATEPEEVPFSPEKVAIEPGLGPEKYATETEMLPIEPEVVPVFPEQDPLKDPQKPGKSSRKSTKSSKKKRKKACIKPAEDQVNVKPIFAWVKGKWIWVKPKAPVADKPQKLSVGDNPEKAPVQPRKLSKTPRPKEVPERLYLIIQLYGEEKVFLVDEIMTCEEAAARRKQEKHLAMAKATAAASKAAIKKYKQRRHSVHDRDAKPQFTPTPLYSVKPTGNFTVDTIMSNRNLYLDILFNHHHRLCADVLGTEEVMKHFARRGRGRQQYRAFSYESIR